MGRAASLVAVVTILAIAAPSVAAPPQKSPAPAAAPSTAPSSSAPPPAPAPSAAPPPADDRAARAAELKKEGDDGMETLRFKDAADAYAKAYALSPTAALLYNRARALQALGQLGEALTYFEQFSAEATPEVKERVHGFDKLLADVRAHVTTLAVRCNVDGVRIRIFDRDLGTTPLEGPVRVNSGVTTLEATATGYFTVRRKLDLPGGGVADVDLHLDSKQVSGVMSVTSPVLGADLSIDGRPMGKVPLETILDAGVHSLQLRHDGYLSLTTDAVITAGERKELNFQLEREAAITTKWWFWTAVGAVVIGGTVTTIALLSSRSPDKGSIPPGEASTPLLRW